MIDEETEVEAIAELLSGEGWHDPRTLKRGGVGLLFRARHPRTKRSVVIKCLQTRFADKAIDDHGVKTYGQLFEREVEAIATLEHRCLMDIIDSGSVRLDESIVPYYVMPYLEGAVNLYEFIEKQTWPTTADFTQWMLASLCDALEALGIMHRATWFHRDLKGDNILVDRNGNIRLMDFGSAWSWSTSLPGSTIGLSDQGYLHPELLPFLKKLEDGTAQKRAFTDVPRELLKQRGAVYDLYALGETLRRIRDDYLPLRGISFTLVDGVIERLKNRSSDTNRGYSDATRVAHELKRLDPSVDLEYLVPEVRPVSPHSIRIVPMMSVSVTEEILAVIDSTLFQRLRGIRQLGFISCVYPSATHTRFEHSLGAFGWAQRYLTALWNAPDQYFRRNIPQECLTATLLATLLHDLGQYTFAHAVEGVNVALSHEALGLELLEPSKPCHVAAPPALLDAIADLHARIDGAFGSTVHGLVVDLLTPYGAPKGMTMETKGLLRSIFDGPIDVDKMDYLRRDGVHTGLGDALSGIEDRFLPSLTPNKSRDGLAVRPSGRDGAERLIDQRYRLFKWVYWHRVSRAIEALVAEVIDRMLVLRGEDAVLAFIRTHAFVCDDGQMLGELIRACNSWGLHSSFADALEGVRHRKLYQRVLTIGPKTDGTTDRFLFHESIYKVMVKLQNESAGGLRAPLRNKKRLFTQELGERTGLKFDEADVIIDVPVPSRHHVGHLRMIASDGSDPLLSNRGISHIWDSIGDDFEEKARRARVFVSPRFEAPIGRDLIELTLKHVFLDEKDDWVRAKEANGLTARDPI
jgi:uncharacterized protein